AKWRITWGSRTRRALRSDRWVITPRAITLMPTGARTDPRNPDVIFIDDSGAVTGVEFKVSVPTRPPVPVISWLDDISFFIPKSIREPFLGDLREDLASMAARGQSLASVWWAAFSQIAILALRLAWSSRRRG